MTHELRNEKNSTKKKGKEDVIVYEVTRGAWKEGLYPDWTD